MNNSVIAIEKVSLSLEDKVDNTEALKQKEAEVVKIIEAIRTILSTAEWSTLKSVFDSRVEDLERRLRVESERISLNDSEIYRLQGRLSEARKYDLEKLAEVYRLELTNIRKLTQPTER